jgi:hypothetical protein
MTARSERFGKLAAEEIMLQLADRIKAIGVPLSGAALAKSIVQLVDDLHADEAAAFERAHNRFNDPRTVDVSSDYL